MLLLSDGVLGAVDESRNMLLPAPVTTPFLSYTPPPTNQQDGTLKASRAPTSTSWFVRWSTEIGSRMPSRPLEQQNVVLKTILERSSFFETVNERTYYIPVGWSGTNEINSGEEIGRLACENFTVGPCRVDVCSVNVNVLQLR